MTESTTQSSNQHALIIGQGYVGLPLAVRAVEAGYNVTGFDLDSAKIEKLLAGESYIEDISNERLQATIKTGRFAGASRPDEIDTFDIAVVSVPTPLTEGAPDLSYIEDAAATVSLRLRRGNTVILESTTYPGTTEELVAPILEQGSGLRAGSDFHLGYSPERIDPGNQTYTLETTPKVVSGIDEASLVAVKAFYDRIVDTTVPVSGTREAELTKLLENTFRHVNIALVNELAMFATDLGIDVWESIDAAATKPFGYMRFTPGPGVGGHCLPIDPSYLSWQVKRRLGTNFRFVDLANDVNEHMPRYVVQRIAANLNRQRRPVNGSRIALLGFAYKRNTSDARETPARLVAEELLRLGAHVIIVDPHVASDAFPPDAESGDFTADTIRAAELVVLLVAHDSFDLELVNSLHTPMLDCQHAAPAASNVEFL